VVHFIKSPQVDCCNYKKKRNKKIGNPNNNEGNDQIKQEDNNKEENNANPTMREMNMTQVDCCKEMFI